MTTTTAGWLTLPVLVLETLLPIGLAIVVVTRSSDGSSAKVYVLWGLGLLALSTSGSMVGHMVLSRWFSVPDAAIAFSALRIATSLVKSLAILFLVAAAFTGRKSLEQAREYSYSGPTDINNPYQPPSS